MNQDKNCAVKEEGKGICGRVVYAKDLCRKHYERQRTTGSIYKAVRKKAGPCLAPDCDRESTCKNLCPGHYQQLLAGKDFTPIRTYHKNNGVDKRCSGCGVIKPLASFYKHKSGRRAGQVFAKCRKCTDLINRAYITGKPHPFSGKPNAKSN